MKNGKATTLLDHFGDHVKDWVTLSLLGLGISFAPYEWFGGMFLALAGAAIAMRLSPEKDNKEIFSVALGAFIVAHLTSILVHSWWPEASVQLWMAVAGFASRHLIRIGMNVLGIVEAKSPAVIESAVDKGAEVLVGKIGDDK